MGSKFAYKKNRRLREKASGMIYECSEKCACGEICMNRVTQWPRKFPLEIFKTADDRGWGIRAKSRIPQGSYLIEYTGEVIDYKESLERGKIYDAKGSSYLFDLDYNDDPEAEHSAFTIDASKHGNLSRLINHSCDPNCHIVPVTTCSKNPLLYKICYFSLRTIENGEELTFNYRGDNHEIEKELDEEEEGGNVIERRFKTNFACKCGSLNCTGRIFDINPISEAVYDNGPRNELAAP
jgi:[histone H3]-lysine9 N-trimethyltransferase SUV39H